MKVTWTELDVPGLLLSGGAAVADQRGSFTKVLSGDDPLLGGFEGRELYWTSSARGVVRGLHFQLPPHATRKLVTSWSTCGSARPWRGSCSRSS